MFRNYFLSAFRNLWRNRGYVLINIVGLSIGIAFSLLIFLHLGVEYGFDRNVPDRDRIYRVVKKTPDGRGAAELSPQLGDQLLSYFSEIEFYTRMVGIRSAVFYSTADGKRDAHRVSGGYFADSTFFDMFGVEALYGDVSKSLRDPKSIVITESLSKRMFGDHIPVGETLETSIDNPKRITAVIPDPPFDSHIEYEFLSPMIRYESVIKTAQPDLWAHPMWSGVLNYIKLKENISITSVEQRMSSFLEGFYAGYLEEDDEILETYICQPLTSIHLDPSFSDDAGPRSNIIYLRIFALVAVVILLIASINYVNINLALGLGRTREVGIRKVVGAKSWQIGQQFLMETGILILIASALSLLAVHLFFPLYTHLTGYPLSTSFLWNLDHLPLFAAIMVSVFLLGGLYPAVQASGFRPAHSIRSGNDPKAIVGSLRTLLLVFQFVISSSILFCTGVIYLQAHYLLNSDLGFETEQVVVYEPQGELREAIAANPDGFKAELMRNPSILSVATVSTLPGSHYSGETLSTEQMPEGTDNSVNVLRADADIVETLGLELVDGRSFAGISPETPAFMLNETAVRSLGLENAVGMIAWNHTWDEYEGQIVGVIKDFNFELMHDAIQPLIIENRPNATRYYLVRITPENNRATIQWISEKLDEFSPGGVYKMQFLDDRIAEMYRSERNLSLIFRTFGMLGIIISTLGLLGMTALMVNSRRREIGIRKVLGANELQIHNLISTRFILWILVANAVALPLSSYFMRRWLENFAYHVQSPLWLYPSTVLGSLLIAMMVISVLTFSAARSNPTEVLRLD